MSSWYYSDSSQLVPNSTTRTPPTDKLPTILQLVVQQICHIAMRKPNISTCQDVGMWQIFVRWWWICCTASCRTCRIVVSSSVGGVVQHVRSRCPCCGVGHLASGEGIMVICVSVCVCVCVCLYASRDCTPQCRISLRGEGNALYPVFSSY